MKKAIEIVHPLKNRFSSGCSNSLNADYTGTDLRSVSSSPLQIKNRVDRSMKKTIEVVHPVKNRLFPGRTNSIIAG